MEVQASSETVLAQAQSFFQQESTHGGEISRPMEYTIQVEDSRSGFPQSAAGWIFNLTLTVLTLGSWLLVWIVWILWKAGETKNLVTITAYPSEAGSLVEVDATAPEWQQDARRVG
jgi:hypothetical protein